MKQYKQLSIEDREKIQLGLWKKISVRRIAQELNRSPSSVTREINKNRDERNRYNPRVSHERKRDFAYHDCDCHNTSNRPTLNSFGIGKLSSEKRRIKNNHIDSRGICSKNGSKPNYCD